jgi:hypothetical protein
MARGCRGCGSRYGVPGCRVCRGKVLCQKCQRLTENDRKPIARKMSTEPKKGDKP